MARTAEVLRTPFAAAAALDMSAALTDFVRQELRRYRLATLEDNKVVSVAALAGRIQAVDDTLDFSPETLRRFLAGERQRTSPEIIRAIAAFLIEEEWLGTEELDSLGQKTDYRAALALGAFFGIKDSTQNKAFHSVLAGRYRQYLLAGDRLMRFDFQITAGDEAGILSFTETIRTYEILPGSLLIERLAQREITPEDYPALQSETVHEKRLVGARLTSSGFGVSDHRVLAFFLTDRRTGQPKLYDILTISFDDEDNVIALSGNCNEGWQGVSAAEDEPDAPPQSPRVIPRDRTLWRRK